MKFIAAFLLFIFGYFIGALDMKSQCPVCSDSREIIQKGISSPPVKKCQSKESQIREAEKCIETMFDDPDRFDPGSHFEVTTGTAPPVEGAAEWINEILRECLEDPREFYLLDY